MSIAILPLEVWEAGTLQNSIPANENALRVEALSRKVLSDSTTSQPVSPSDGDVYIIASTHTGTQWATFNPGDIAIYRGGTWHAFAPVAGVVLNVNGTQKQYTGSAWAAIGGGGGTIKVTTAVTSNTITPDADTDIVRPAALSAGLTIDDPSGTPLDGWGMVFELKDNGSARALTWGSKYTSRIATLPTTTTAGKQHVIGGTYNAADDKVYIDYAMVQA